MYRDKVKDLERSERLKWLAENKSLVLAEKKAQLKHADAFEWASPSQVNKAAREITGDEMKVTAVINTTNVMDSHDDVHINGLWTKTLKETKDIYLVREHNFTFDGIISDEVKAYAKDISWKDLGYKYPGDTQALIFEAQLTRKGAGEMFNRYANGKVKQHSVGMRYVKVEMAIDDDDEPQSKKVWDKYIDRIINKDEAIEQGYFFAVTEAKVIEGSAVVRGSNHITPTLAIEEKTEPQHSDEPPRTLDVNQILSFYKL